ncbi:class I SAM-dependent methyltransferase [Streptosporangium sp. CA-115845]|uniref:class I SAM-dependent methyltransferase n=1 Tax=Streptosporangium sp. CA-115845 TaxID=3240071 RepID=UPI003D924110
MMLDVEEHLSLDERSAVDFVGGLRARWAHEFYPRLAADARGGGDDVTTLAGATSALRRSPLYSWFAHLERQQQKMLWRAAGDAVLRLRKELSSGLDVPGSPELDPRLSLPDWYTDVDIHLQPGSFFAADASAFIYELGARVVMLRDNDGYKFHRLFAETALPDLPGAARVVDIGCGFGKSTRPLAAKYPDAEIVGIDLSAPNLRLAHAQAVSAGLSLRYRQAFGSATGLEYGSADLVTGTMVLHEMPDAEIAATLAEAARLLRPGGSVRFLEFWPTGDPVRDATVYEHAERNNEPYFRDLFGIDTARVCAEAGLTGARWTPFDEREHGLLSGDRPERREWFFPWAVLCAEKPETTV